MHRQSVTMYHTKALRVEREKKAAEAEARDAKKAAKLKKENDAKQAALGLDKIEKKNDTAEAPAPAEEADGLCDAFEGLDLSEKYGHDWSMTEVQNDKVHLLLTARVCNPESCAIGRSPRSRSSTTWMPTLATSSKQPTASQSAKVDLRRLQRMFLCKPTRYVLAVV